MRDSSGAARRSAIVFALFAVLGCAATLRPLSPLPGPVTGSEGGTSSVAADASDMAYFDSIPLMVPVEDVAPTGVSDSYNEAHSDGRTHRASNILVPIGTRVLAAEAGTIMRPSHNALGGT